LLSGKITTKKLFKNVERVGKSAKVEIGILTKRIAAGGVSVGKVEGIVLGGIGASSGKSSTGAGFEGRMTILVIGIFFLVITLRTATMIPPMVTDFPT